MTTPDPRDDEVVAAVRDDLVAALRATGARFAFLHGSRARGAPRPDSDVDVAAWWGASAHAPASFEVDLSPRVDPLVLDGAPLEVAGRVSTQGVLLFDDDPVARVAIAEWVSRQD